MKADLVELRGKTALITGGARRLGAATARALAQSGVNVALHYRRSRSEAERLADELRIHRITVACVQGDLAEPNAGPEIFHAAIKALGPIDFLINNASIFPEGALGEFSAEDLDLNVRVNALAPLSLSRCLAAQARDGCIVNFLDTRIVDYDEKHVPYHLSKRMLFSLTRMMAAEFAPRVRVNAVAPGLILPPEGRDDAWLQSLAHTNPLHRIGSPDGIADAVLFLLRAGFVTGQVIYVDGGRHLRSNFYG